MRQSRSALALVSVLAFVTVFGSPAWAADYWVDDDACPEAGSGTPADPFCSIQSGIDAASAGDTVQVAAGTYFENITMKSGVVIQGAGQGVSIIDGGANGTVVTAVDVDSAATLDGFTITNGGNTFVGGGMYNENSSPTVSNCTFSENSAITGVGIGGGMYNSYSSPTVTGCTFSGNQALWDGGGMWNGTSSPVVTDCEFSGNMAGDGGLGGGMYNLASSVTLTRCVFSRNSAHGGYGGALENVSSATTVRDSTFFENSAYSAAAARNRESGAILTFVNCVFYGNQAVDPNTGIDIWSDQVLTVTNSTFWTADSSIYNNSATAPTITNCIFWGGWLYTIWTVAGKPPAVVTYSVILAEGTGNIDADPKFVDRPGGDLRLRPDSPCIDAGDNSAPALPATDMDGYDRKIDDPGVVDTGHGTPPIVDMGAYEFDPLRPVFSDGFECGSCASWSSAVGEVP
jgi:hypothetical protein